jgi:hypothetical protein
MLENNANQNEVLFFLFYFIFDEQGAILLSLNVKNLAKKHNTDEPKN